MKLDKGKIIEATDAELFHKYLDEDWDDCMPFEEYKYRMRQSGVTITEDKHEGN